MRSMRDSEASGVSLPVPIPFCPSPLSIVLVAVCVGCNSLSTGGEPSPLEKITFDLSDLDDEGLRGPLDGKVAVAYEFCIPDTLEHRAEVKSIDPTVEFLPGARGRIGCKKGQCLCIGSTHQENFRTVLRGLAARPYIARIDECFFE